jgi:flagellar motor switch protein FliM
MENNPVLTQGEIDKAFRKERDHGDEKPQKLEVYNFRRAERLPKDQIQAIRRLHEDFGRRLATTLSAHLRAYVVVNLVSIEQIPFAEFAQALPAPTTFIPLGIKPYEGFALFEINPTLAFPILEILLGGSGKVSAKMDRAITEIEQNILDGLLAIVLNDLRASWQTITTMQFSIESHETEPLLSQIAAPNELMVAVSIEVHIGDAVVGMMNLGIPSVILKMLRQKFDHQGSDRRAHATEAEQERMLRRLRPAIIHADVRLQGPSLAVAALLDLKEDDVLVFDYPIERPVDLMLNGKLKYLGEVVRIGGKRAVEIGQPCSIP